MLPLTQQSTDVLLCNRQLQAYRHSSWRNDGKLNSEDINDLDDRDERSDAIWRRYPTNLNGPLTVDFVNGIAFRVLY